MPTRTLRPSFTRMVGRAVLRRCPWCSGRGAWFVGWFRRSERCRTCGLRWNRRQDGFELGAMTVATLLTGGAVMTFLTITIIVTYPDVAVLPIAVGGAALALVVPVITYPFTYTLWSAFDLAVHPPARNEFCEGTPEHLLPPEVSGAAAARQRSNWASGPQ